MKTADADLGLTTAQVEAVRREAPATRRPRGSRTYAQIARTNIFTFYNNVLFVIGVGLLALDRTNDAVVSVGLGLLNAVISSVQEMRAKKKLDALRLLHRSVSRVVRDGVEIEVPPEELVRGDLLRIGAGDQVVVDGPVEGPGWLEVDESLLTGESGAVPKTAGDLLLSGSYVISGESRQRAAAVGPGSHAEQVTAAARRWTSSQTPLQRRIDIVVRAVIATVALMSVAIMGQALMEGLPLVRLVQMSAVLSGLVPYGLFFMVAVSYSMGAATIARRGGLVQQVSVVESLSNVDVVCTDKTGTLTTGRLQLHTVHPSLPDLDEAHVRQLVGAVARGATSANATTDALVEALPGARVAVTEEVPFASARRWSGVTLGGDSSSSSDSRAPRGTYVLGAVQALATSLPADTVADGAPLPAAVESYTAQGLRVLVLARAAEQEAPLHDRGGSPTLPRLVALGLVVLADELRPHVRETLADLAASGVEVKVVSGDDPRTVAALVAQLGLSDQRPISGAELAELRPEARDDAVRDRTVFGRIAPEQKEEIVDSLIRAGRYVAMIGDGVNDVRSLKRAQVGVAMQSGSSVASDVADLVLLNDSFAALPLARHEGQRIIGGLSTALRLFLSRVAASMVIIVGVAILGLGFPYEPAQVALTLFTVGVPSLFLTWWARPQRPDPRLILDLARFVVPVAVVTGPGPTPPSSRPPRSRWRRRGCRCSPR